MADQIFVVGFKSGEKADFVRVEGSEVIEDKQYVMVKGSKGMLWVSKAEFIYTFPESMYVQKG